ncbi:integrase core domain-containing protein [Spirillospora sp. CA-255316]
MRSQADVLLAGDFLETVTLSGVRMYVPAVIEHRTRRIKVLGATASWVTQAVRNLVMDLKDAGCRARFLIRDRDGKYPGLFDAVLSDAGIEVVLTGTGMPRMNAVMERWVQTCRHELLDRTLIWNQRQLLHALREFEAFYNEHRPHQGIANTRPLQPLPPIVEPADIAPEGTTAPTSGRNPPRVSACRLTLLGWNFRQAHLQGSWAPWLDENAISV